MNTTKAAFGDIVFREYVKASVSEASHKPLLASPLKSRLERWHEAFDFTQYTLPSQFINCLRPIPTRIIVNAQPAENATISGGFWHLLD